MDELLTGKDLDTIARAHRHCREMEIERTLGALRVRVSTLSLIHISEPTRH